jgi:fumarylacetoacetate (FAA) hydrolase
MSFHFGELLAHLCKTRNVRAGSVVGSGTVSNVDQSHGYSCIAEKRVIETIQDGQPVTEFMKYGDTIRIDMKGLDGISVCGTIEQDIVPPA